MMMARTGRAVWGSAVQCDAVWLDGAGPRPAGDLDNMDAASERPRFEIKKVRGWAVLLAAVLTRV